MGFGKKPLFGVLPPLIPPMGNPIKAVTAPIDALSSKNPVEAFAEMPVKDAENSFTDINKTAKQTLGGT